MRIYTSLALVLALGVLEAPRTFSAEPDKLPAGMINFRGAAVPQVLAVYETLADARLITDSRVKKIGTPITLKNETAISREQAVVLIEHALLEQAAIIITPLGENRASATYNDALPIVSNAAGESTSTDPMPPAEHSASVMQHFRVDTNSFFSKLRSRMKSDGEQLDGSLLTDYFKQQGIDVSPPFSTLYRPGTGDLLIRPKQKDRAKIGRLMTELQSGK